MAKSPSLHIHRLLLKAFPKVHFHVQTAKERDQNGILDNNTKATIITVSYDSDELAESSGKADLTNFVKSALDDFYEARGKKNHFTSIRIDERESAQSAENRRLQEFVDGFKNLVASEADDSILKNYAKENVFKLPWQGPTAASA